MCYLKATILVFSVYSTSVAIYAVSVDNSTGKQVIRSISKHDQSVQMQIVL